MEVTEQVARRLGLRVTVRGGLRLIKAEEALRFLDACEVEGVRVLGMEGFMLEGKDTVPDMDAIADFSSPRGMYSVAESIRDARRFVRAKLSPGILFDFTLERVGLPRDFTGLRPPDG